MKILSKTEEHGRVVELTEQEFAEFAKLAFAVEGKSEGEARWDFQMRDRDMVLDNISFDGVFGAITAFYSAKFRANEIRQLLERFENTIKEK